MKSVQRDFDTRILAASARGRLEGRSASANRQLLNALAMSSVGSTIFSLQLASRIMLKGTLYETSHKRLPINVLPLHLRRTHVTAKPMSSAQKKRAIDLGVDLPAVLRNLHLSRVTDQELMYCKRPASDEAMNEEDYVLQYSFSWSEPHYFRHERKLGRRFTDWQQFRPWKDDDELCAFAILKQLVPYRDVSAIVPQGFTAL